MTTEERLKQLEAEHKQLEAEQARTKRSVGQLAYALCKTQAWRPEANGQEALAAIWAEVHRAEAAERRAAEIEGERKRAEVAA